MAGLPRSALSFRRQGSSGLVWDDRFLSGELVKLNNKEGGDQRRQLQQEEIERNQKSHGMKEIKTKKTPGSIHTVERSRSSGGGHGFKAGKVSLADDEPPSPKLSACGFCGVFRKKGNKVGQTKTGVIRRTR